MLSALNRALDSAKQGAKAAYRLGRRALVPVNQERAQRDVERGKAALFIRESDGFRFLTDDAKMRRDALLRELVYGDINNVARTRARVEELDWLLTWADSAVEAGKQAQGELRKHE